MRKVIACLVIVMFCLSIPLAVQADKADVYRSMEAKLKAASGDRSLAQGYEYAIVFGYSVNDGFWWTGVAVYNFSAEDNNFLIGTFDEDGNVIAEATFILGDGALRADLLADFFAEELVFLTPDGRASIAIFATEPFSADKFVGNTDGGFGELERDGEYY